MSANNFFFFFYVSATHLTVTARLRRNQNAKCQRIVMFCCWVCLCVCRCWRLGWGRRGGGGGGEGRVYQVVNLRKCVELYRPTGGVGVKSRAVCNKLDLKKTHTQKKTCSYASFRSNKGKWRSAFPFFFFFLFVCLFCVCLQLACAWTTCALGVFVILQGKKLVLYM